MKTKFTLFSNIKRFGAVLAVALVMSVTASAQSFSGTFVSTSTPQYNVTIIFSNFTLNKTCNGGGFTYYTSFDYNVFFTQTSSQALAHPGPYFPSISSLTGSFGCGSTIVNFNNLSSYTTPWITNQSGTGVAVNASYNSLTPSCASANFTNIGCDSAGVAIQGNGFQRSGDPLAYTPPGITLPIKLVRFDGDIVDKGVNLTWMTGTETNNMEFAIERSSDAKEWTVVKTMAGAGTTNQKQSYQFLDEKPATASVTYYRLKQIDANGDFTYSYTLALKTASIGSDLAIYPNPAADNTLHIMGINNPAGWQISVSNTASQQLYSGALSGNTVTLPSLSAGLYFVRLVNNENSTSKVFKYIKQ